MKLILDTANLDDIRYFNTYYPISGVTTNPTILSREGGDIVKHLHTIREIIGKDKELHIQVTETEYDKIISEAKAIVAAFGENTFVKIPATDVGLRATAALSKEGIGVTVTAVFSAGQALLAATAGAAYVAPYVSRLENICEDGIGVVAEIQQVLDCGDYDTVILAASFKTAREVLDVALAGSGA
ncbi:MAG: fructose-6-phosphate aldolase, partial [Clostridia bacterium]|nr:fructose-6-phosphate aldolase [Clostridia bacterium]